MVASSTTLHEAADQLTPRTIDIHRAVVSLIEELEAFDWYNQRAEAAQDPQLQAVLKHNRDEEIEHASMTLEWIRRHVAKFDEALASLKVEDAGAFTAQVREIRGDALVAKGDMEGARAEYAAALADANTPQVDRSMLELKLQDVGGQAPKGADQGALK